MAKTPTNPGTAPPSESDDASELAGKGRPTPTRREKEAARKRPLVANDRAAARQQTRERARAQRDRARIGLANGEERYLPVRDRGPQKKFVRDYVDARYSVGEALIPLMVIVIISTVFPPAWQAIAILAIYGILLIAIVDAVIVGGIVKRKLGAKFGETRVERGVRLYAAMRAMYMRFMRLPKPRVKRGEYPT